MNTKTCICIVGPTASGKTNIAIQLAQYFNTSILSADSRQCYQQLNIGVAKPSPSQLNAVPHFFINTHSVEQPVNVAIFFEYAQKILNELFKTKDIIIVVGGTGLYINSLQYPLNDIPDIAIEIKQYVENLYLQQGLQGLQEHIQKIDPLYYQQGEIFNHRRLIRALCVALQTKQSILSFYNKNPHNQFNIIKIGLQLSREKLYHNINNRVDDMIQQGLIQEAQQLQPYQHYKALDTIGYKELFPFFNSQYTQQDAINLIKQHTRNYAKRQLTWFNKYKDIQWVNTDTSIDNIISLLTHQLKNN